jgi:2-octaprenyl-6-methoxyphenol hydroxylase
VTKVDATPAYARIRGECQGAPCEWTARLAAVADGGGDVVAASTRHRHDYGQVALIAKLWRDEPHGGVAYERFTPEGPMALLPEGDHYGLVWTTTPAQGAVLAAMPEREFLAALAARFGALHPVAGQGFNLGVRDAYELAQALLATPRDRLGTADSLSDYARHRLADRWAGIALTHCLLGVFGSDAALLRWPRGLALTLLDALPPLKRIFTDAMLYGLR